MTTGPAGAQLDPLIQLEIYGRMALISQNDAATRRALSAGRLRMPYYSPKGQEVIPAAISTCLRPDDQIATIYRGVHDMLAKGVPLDLLWAEQAGRFTGACKGKGGPMHVSHPPTGIMVTTGIVGSSMPIANGLGWAAQMDGSDRVVVAYFGDGAANIGAFHESLNLASVWKLPVIFVCQNNRYAEHTRYDKATAVARIADRAASYTMPGHHVDGNDPLAMYAAAREAVDLARSGGGPTLIEAMTFRFYGHVLGDADEYMDKAEKAEAMANDPTIRFRASLVEHGLASETQLAEMEARIDAEIEAAIKFALDSPFPDLSELRHDVFAEEMVG